MVRFLIDSAHKSDGNNKVCRRFSFLYFPDGELNVFLGPQRPCPQIILSRFVIIKLLHSGVNATLVFRAMDLSKSFPCVAGCFGTL